MSDPFGAVILHLRALVAGVCTNPDFGGVGKKENPTNFIHSFSGISHVFIITIKLLFSLLL